ncbi:MAG: hypothetical protein COB76_05050 [Alphaproteobacteria bacterium]|nr:MAG: hypothetical protein COB76_05050 [Alphaproteobacteria bacterium]
MSGEIKSALGILAGEGALPHQVTQYCIENDIPVCAVLFEGCSYVDDFSNIPTHQTRIEKVGSVFKFFKRNNVTDVVMIGNLSRPEILSLRPDWQGIKTLIKIARVFSKGDDALLTTLRSEIELQGFTVRGVDYYLNDLTSDPKCLTRTTCAIDLTFAVMETLRHGQADKGQAVLIHCDDSFSYEQRQGTRHLIETYGRKGSILIKAMKPQQDPDLDRPTVGLQTLKTLKENNCAGLVVEADAVFMINKGEMISYANENEMFIEVINV